RLHAIKQGGHPGLVRVLLLQGAQAGRGFLQQGDRWVKAHGNLQMSIGKQNYHSQLAYMTGSSADATCTCHTWFPGNTIGKTPVKASGWAGLTKTVRPV